jgi:hypothetical protein
MLRQFHTCQIYLFETLKNCSKRCIKFFLKDIFIAYYLHI